MNFELWSWDLGRSCSSRGQGMAIDVASRLEFCPCIDRVECVLCVGLMQAFFNACGPI